MRFECPNHGEVEPEGIMYSCPAQASCPKCGRRLDDLDGGIKIIEDEKECVLLRPDFYKKTAS